MVINETVVIKLIWRWRLTLMTTMIMMVIMICATLDDSDDDIKHIFVNYVGERPWWPIQSPNK